MKMRLAITVAIVLLADSFGAANLAFAGECEGILGYLQDRTDLYVSNKNYASFQRFFCSQESSSFGQARDAGVKVGVPIEGIPIDFGGYSRDSNWGNYQKSLSAKLFVRPTSRPTTFA